MSDEIMEQRSVRVLTQLDATYRKQAKGLALEAQQLLARNDGIHNMHGHAGYLMGLPKQDYWISTFNMQLAEQMIKSMRIADRTKQWPDNNAVREAELFALRVENERLVRRVTELELQLPH